MERYEKVYVSMHLHVDRQGKLKPTAIEWEDGRAYKIDKVTDERMAPPAHVGAILARRYDVLVEGREKTVYLETPTNQWFVERPLYE